MILKIFTDGGSKGNPGPSAVGVVFYNSDNKELFTYREDIGDSTNNIAEYTAVIRALETITNDKLRITNEVIDKLDFFSDSTLMVNQINGIFKVKHPNIIPLIDKVRNLLTEIDIPYSFTYIPREKNKKADALVNNLLT